MSRKTSRCGGGETEACTGDGCLYSYMRSNSIQDIIGRSRHLIDIKGSQSNFIDFDPVLRSEIWKGGGGWQSVCRHCTVYSK